MIKVLFQVFILFCFVGSGPAYSAKEKGKIASKLEIPSDETLGFYLGTRDEVKSQYKRVGLLPVRMPNYFEEREDVKNALAELVTQYLSQAGMDVVPSASYVKSYDRLNQQLGGIYNVDTGDIKADVYAAVTENAEREFIENEHLNGMVLISVKRTEASFYGSDAYFNGAQECILGRKPPNGLADFLFGNSNLRGTLSAYAVVVQVLNTQDKVVYGRSGGIQLANYYDPNSKGGVNNFLFVPSKDLFLDRARLERGVRLATDPLIRTPHDIAATEKDPHKNPRLIDPATLPLPPLGVANVSESPLRKTRGEILESVKKIYIGSLNGGKYKMPAEAEERFVKLISDEMQRVNIETIHAKETRALWDEKIGASKGLFDASTGKIKEEKIAEIRKDIVQKIGVSADSAFLWISPIRVSAPYKGEIAKWDGVVQDIFTLEFPKNSSVWGGAEGGISALSLNLILRDSKDELFYISRAGLQLLQQMKDGKAVDLAPQELFQKNIYEKKSIHVALRELTLSEEELYKELHPNSAAKSKNRKDKKQKEEESSEHQ